MEMKTGSSLRGCKYPGARTWSVCAHHFHHPPRYAKAYRAPDISPVQYRLDTSFSLIFPWLYRNVQDAKDFNALAI